MLDFKTLTLNWHVFSLFQTYVYVLDSDIDTPILDPDTIKDQNLRIMEDSSNVATAFMSLWEPRLHSTSDNGTVETTSSAGLFSGPRGELFSSILRIISPKDILESYDAAVKGVCLVPTQMNKIYCQVRDHPYMTSDDFGPFLTYLPTLIRWFIT